MVIHGIVAIGTIRVVDVVSVLKLEKALHVVVDGFAVLLVVFLAGVVKEVCERFVSVLIARTVGGIRTGIDRRVTAYQLLLHKRKASGTINNAFARPFVNARACATIKFELMTLIDAAVNIIDSCRFIVVAIHDPVVKQIDRGVGGIHRLYGMVAIGNNLVGRRTRRTKHERARRQRDGQNL